MDPRSSYFLVSPFLIGQLFLLVIIHVHVTSGGCCCGNNKKNNEPVVVMMAPAAAAGGKSGKARDSGVRPSNGSLLSSPGIKVYQGGKLLKLASAGTSTATNNLLSSLGIQLGKSNKQSILSGNRFQSQPVSAGSNVLNLQQVVTNTLYSGGGIGVKSPPSVANSLSPSTQMLTSINRQVNTVDSQSTSTNQQQQQSIIGVGAGLITSGASKSQVNGPGDIINGEEEGTLTAVGQGGQDRLGQGQNVQGLSGQGQSGQGQLDQEQGQWKGHLWQGQGQGQFLGQGQIFQGQGRRQGQIGQRLDQFGVQGQLQGHGQFSQGQRPIQGQGLMGQGLMNPMSQLALGGRGGGVGGAGGGRYYSGFGNGNGLVNNGVSGYGAEGRFGSYGGYNAAGVRRPLYSGGSGGGSRFSGGVYGSGTRHDGYNGGYLPGGAKGEEHLWQSYYYNKPGDTTTAQRGEAAALFNNIDKQLSSEALDMDTTTTEEDAKIEPSSTTVSIPRKTKVVQRKVTIKRTTITTTTTSTTTMAKTKLSQQNSKINLLELSASEYYDENKETADRSVIVETEIKSEVSENRQEALNITILNEKSAHTSLGIVDKKQSSSDYYD